MSISDFPLPERLDGRVSEFTNASELAEPTYLLNAASISLLVTHGGVRIWVGRLLMVVGVVLSRGLAFVVNVVMGQPGPVVDDVVFKGGRGGGRGRPWRAHSVYGGYRGHSGGGGKEKVRVRAIQLYMSKIFLDNMTAKSI